jgi:hypothetical protein
MSATKAVFQKYLNHIFIETGSHVGDGIQQALDAGFKLVHSIELSEALYERCCNRFVDDDRVVLHLGDSHLLLDDILFWINEPVTFWLDAHCSCGETVRGKYYSSLLQELMIIDNHPVRTHTILIDDVRL